MLMNTTVTGPVQLGEVLKVRNWDGNGGMAVYTIGPKTVSGVHDANGWYKGGTN